MAIIRVPVVISNPVLPDPAMNILHIRTITDDPDSGVIDSALDAIFDFYDSLKAHYPSGTTIRLGEGMIKDPLGSPSYVPDDPREIASGTTTDPLPALLAVVVSWRTTSATRSGRGRTFVGPLHIDSLQSDGTPEALTLTAIRDAANALVAESSSSLNGWAFGVLSTKTGVFRDVTGNKVADRFSYLSSRRD